MCKALEGKTAVVTGGGKGIGLAITKTLAEKGASVVLLGRDLKALELLAKQIEGSKAVQADVASEASIHAAFARLSSCDILVNNAGIASSAPFERTSPKEWERAFAVNLMGAVRCTLEVLPGMRQRHFGRIVNVASTAGLRGYPYVSAYCASKHAMVGFTKALALEVARDGITVNAVCPSFSETDMLAESVQRIVEATGKDPEKVRSLLMGTNPQGRFVTPDEIAAMVVWLCLPGAEGVNGQAIPIDGGETAR